jgi:hypothetical protein
MFAGNSVSAQTGPGGVGDAATNVLWLSADYGVYSDAGTTPAANGNNAQQWNDRSGNGKHAVESNSANRPNYQTGQLNGLPVIRYTAANGDRLLSSGVAVSNTASVWVVARYTSLPSPNPGLVQGAPAGFSFDGNTNNKSIGMWVSSVSPFQVWGRGVQTDNTLRDIPQAVSTTSNTPYVISNIYGTNSIDQYLNGAAAGSNTVHNGTLKNWSEFGIGRQASESWNGDIAEVIVFNTALNAAQRIIIDNYLAAKYGFLLTANDIYNEDTNGNYDFDVAGIGRASDGSQHSDAQGSIVRISGPSSLGINDFYFWGHNNGSMSPTTAGIPSGVTERLTRIWRGSELNNVGSVDVSFDMTGFGPFAASDLRLLVDTDNDNSFVDEINGVGIISGASASGNVYTFQNVTQLNDNRRFTIAVANVTLPVELLNFEAHANDRTVNLSWSTASETNNDIFTVERSADGHNFDLVAKISGAGTANERSDYDLTDSRPYGGRSYYRLSQTDFDGTTEYFPLVSVEIDMREVSFSVYPNPSDGEFNVLVSNVAEGEPLSIAVFDLQGNEVFPGAPVTSDGMVITSFRVAPERQLQPGLYVVKINYSGNLHVEKVLIR